MAQEVYNESDHFKALYTVLAATTVSVAQAQTPTASVTQIVAADAEPMDKRATDSGAADHFIDVKVRESTG